jgi:Fe-S-cluster-containing dehydrogenase component
MERTGLVSGEPCVTVCIAVRRAEIVGKMIQDRETERVTERQREDKTVNTRRMLGTSPRLLYVVIANSIKVQ